MAIVVTDASNKLLQMGVVWILIDTTCSFEIKYRLYYQDQNQNSPKVAEACILLDFIIMIEQKSKYISNESLRIVIDNQSIYNIINGKIDIPMKYTQGAAA